MKRIFVILIALLVLLPVPVVALAPSINMTGEEAPCIGCDPSSAGYTWDCERGGWYRVVDPIDSFTLPSEAPWWDEFIPECVEGALVSIPDASVPYGEAVTIPISIANAAHLGAVTIFLHYDSSVVKVVSVADGNLAGGIYISNNDVANAICKMGWFTIGMGQSGDFVFADITLRAMGSAGQTSPLTLEVRILADATNGLPIMRTVSNGMFTVDAPPMPSFPLAFSGVVTIGGVKAPDGTVVTAEIADIEVATTITVSGYYMLVIALNGNMGKMVTFKVDGIVGGEAEYTNPWVYPIVYLDLSIAGPEPIVPIIRGEENITVCYRDTFIISFHHSRSTAYDWTIDYNGRKLRIVDSWQVCDPPMPGSGCTYYFKLKALRLGETQIVVTYARPWPGDPVYQDVYNVEVLRCRYPRLTAYARLR